jgi:hypothetical protein
MDGDAKPRRRLGYDHQGVLVNSITHKAVAVSVFALSAMLCVAQLPAAQSMHTFTGFDQNLYPGDAMLPLLKKNLDFVGYWLNTPPGSNVNTWSGKRTILRDHGFGFIVLFNSRSGKALKRVDAAAAGRSDAVLAIAAAKREGFPVKTIIFLDLEDGGRMEHAVSDYVVAWADAVRHSDFRPGVYCSGIEVEDDPGPKISTADDVRTKAGDVALWIANDVCPPAPGCHVPHGDLTMEQSGRTDTLVWQFAQSPRRREFTTSCVATYARDGNCYAPDVPHSDRTLLDLNLSSSPDPSGGR